MTYTFIEQARTMSYDAEYLLHLAECEAERVDPVPYAEFMEEMEEAWDQRNSEFSYFHSARV